MRVTRLDIRNLRKFRDVHMTPGPGLNLITGENGAGKTSILEAQHLMAYGRSFRGRVRDGLVRDGADALEVFIEWEAPHARAALAPGVPAPPAKHRAGLRHWGHRWEGRLDGDEVRQLGELCAAFAVVSFEPGSHALVTGPAEHRRRYMDWALFHVEQGFLDAWRRYARALRQRNALLKGRGSARDLEPWDHELAQWGELVNSHRRRYATELEPELVRTAAELAPSLGLSALDYLPGWREQDLPLVDALLVARERDLQTGFTSVGPHRADLKLDYAHVPGREALSRGQAKLAALSALLAQASHLSRSVGTWPVVALDDLTSELDLRHQQRVLRKLVDCGAQVFITGTEPSAAMKGDRLDFATFHVEHGVISAGALG